MSATLENLLHWLINPLRQVEIEYFLMCMESYTTAKIVWNHLQRYFIETYTPEDWNNRGELIFLSKWIDLAFMRDFSTFQRTEPSLFKPLMKLCKKLPNYISNRIKLAVLKQTTPKSSTSFLSIYKKEKRRSLEDLMKFGKLTTKVEKPTARTSYNKLPDRVCLLATGDMRDLAEQITLYNFKMFEMVNPSEFLDAGFQKEGSTFKCTARIFNHIAGWVATEIVTTYNINTRIKVLSNSIDLAKNLRKLGNYFGMMAVLAALGMCVVVGLRKTWKGLDSKYQKTHQKLDKLVDSRNNFASYREELRNKKGPVVPYLGVFSRDFTFIEDGNPKFVDDKINFERISMCGAMIRQFTLMQKTPYNFVENKDTQNYVREFYVLSEEVLDASSQNCEK